MSANPDSVEKSFSERLTEFDSKIRLQDDNASLLNEIHAALTTLMSPTGGQEDEVREILQKRYNAGKLRLETYQLVRNVLDRVVLESMPTMPGTDDDADDASLEDHDDGEDSRDDAAVIAGSRAEAQKGHLQIGSVLRDRFLLQERVAGGSMGVVYKAHDRRLAEADGVDPWVAIKVLSPKLSRNAHALRALQQEAAKGRCLSHPNIVRFIDLDRDDDIYFIVMEWLEGRSLATILDENKKMKVDLKTSLDIVRQVGLALDYAHRCGVVHADVKPANIMVTPAGEVKLFDFGIARIRQKEQENRNSFDPGVLGAITPAYSSMQVLTGEDPVPTDDVFSLGCLMYRLVAGHRVFGPRNAAEAAEQGLEPQRPQGLSDPQWRALRKALAYSRVARFKSPAEFVEALGSEEGVGSEAPFHRGAGAPLLVEAKSQPPLLQDRRYWPAALAVVALVAVAVALFSMAIMPNDQSMFDRTRALFAPDGGQQESLPSVDGAAVEPPEPLDQPGSRQEDQARDSGERAGVADRQPEDSIETPEREREDHTATAPAASPPASAGESQQLEREPAPVAVDPVGGQGVTEDASPRQADDLADAAGRESPAPGATVGEQGAEGSLESGLPQDTVGFRVSRMYVSEGEAAVRIDILRLNPSDSRLEVRYFVGGGTATEGEDYFLPDAFRLVFAPRQRMARLLIPLVQDSVLESDETLSLELMTDIENPEANIFPRIEVIIRDNDG